MKTIGKTILAILFAVALIEVVVLVNNHTAIKLTNFRLLGLAAGAAALYYFIFERKKKMK